MQIKKKICFLQSYSFCEMHYINKMLISLAWSLFNCYVLSKFERLIIFHYTYLMRELAKFLVFVKFYICN